VSILGNRINTNKLEISTFRIYALLIALFTVLPGYVIIFGINSEIVVVILMLVVGMLSIKMHNRQSIRYNFFFWLFLILYNIQVLFDSGSFEAFKYLLQYILLCLIFIKTVSNINRFFTVIDFLIYASFVLEVFGIFEAFIGTNILHALAPDIKFAAETRLGLLRVMTTFYHPISYCNYLMFVGSLILYRLQSQEQISKLKFLKIAYTMMFVNIILTLSRSTMIIFALSQIIIAYKIGYLKWSVKKNWYVMAAFMLILILMLIGSNIIELAKNVIYMFLSLVDSSFLSKITVSFGTNELGVGNRFDLYKWVYWTVRNNSILGMGTNTSFAYAINAYQTKSSIEVEYLNIFFKHGFVGLISMVAACISTIIFLFRRVKAFKISTDIVSFNFVALITMLGYYTSFFAVNQSRDVKIYLVFMCLVIVYNHKKFRTVNEV
jgi:hypothetical protein